MISRRQFLQFAAAATVRLPASAPRIVGGATARPGRSAEREGGQPDQRAGKPRGSEFVFAREWDYDWRNKRFLREDNTKFAVNIVVYAMG